jgi:hypothetical protein
MKHGRFMATSLVVMASASLGLGGATATAATGPTVQGFAADYMAKAPPPVTRAQAVAQAQRFDVIVAYAATYRAYVIDMHAANPNLVLLAYENASFLDKGTDPNGTLYPDSWYSHNCLGHQLRSKGFAAWLMDVNDAPGDAWVENRVAKAGDLLSFSGYDGIFLDMMGPAPTVGHYVLDAVTGLDSAPIKPGVSPCANWTGFKWMAANGTIAQRIGAATGRQVWGNGLGSGPSYFSTGVPTQRLQSATVGAMAEAFVRGEMDPIARHRSEAQWKQDVDMLSDAGARGESVLAITKVWVSATQAQLDAWHKYSLASFLLAANGYTHFSFRADHALAGDEPWSHIDLGSPLGAYAKVDGVYQRTFANGRVLVNPTLSTLTVPLGGSYITIEGLTTSSVTLQPNSAEILTPA